MISHRIRQRWQTTWSIDSSRAEEMLSRDNMTLEGRTAGVLCLVNVSEPCLECRIHVDTVLEPQSLGTATLENRGRWRSIWQPPSDIPFLVMFRFTYSLLDRIHAWPGTYYLNLSIFIFPVLYIRTTRTCMQSREPPLAYYQRLAQCDCCFVWFISSVRLTCLIVV